MSLCPVLSPEQVRAWDDAAEAAGTPLAALMERAGEAVANVVLERFDALARRGVLVACGPGNNGGDGWVAARILHGHGLPVAVIESGTAAAGIAADARAAALADGVTLASFAGPRPPTAVAIDALLGTGSVGTPRADVSALIARLASLRVPIVAIDGPSGLDLGTGVEDGALRAAVTVTFGGPRRGHLMARDVVGDIVIADIGMPAAPVDVPVLIDSDWAAARLDPLPARSHKGSRGRVVVVGGAPSMTGAARLVARGAFAAGAGLVHVVAPAASLAVLRMAEPDVQTMEHDFVAPLDDEMVTLLQHADAVVIGPGLGREDERAAFVLAVLEHAKRAVIDADALIVLAGMRDHLMRLADSRPLVLTPHLGEYASMFGDARADPARDPWGAAVHAHKVTGCTVLLKGVPTVIASAGPAPRTVATGNPGMATGGSGDTLAGVIAALLAQRVPVGDAATLAAQAMGEAGDHAARRVTARAMRPSDVVAALPDVWRAWARRRAAPVQSSWRVIAAPCST